MTIVSLPDFRANKLLEAGTVKIGLSVGFRRKYHLECVFNVWSAQASTMGLTDAGGVAKKNSWHEIVRKNLKACYVKMKR